MMLAAAAALVSARGAGATKWVLAHLPDGQPDFQGYWTNATYTPLERDRELGTKEFFEQKSPYAYQDMAARMVETVRKGYWDADAATKKKLLSEYI